jgi:hypothetical protein
MLSVSNRQLMKLLRGIVTAVLFCSISPNLFASTTKHIEAVSAPERLQMAVSCLFSAKWMRDYFFSSFGGFKEGNWIWVRYQVGAIPGDVPVPGVYYVMVYSRDGRHGFLLETPPNSLGGFTATANDYTLEKTHGRWHVLEGEGGFRDYQVVERWVNHISGQPRYRVQLLPGGKECDSD